LINLAQDRDKWQALVYILITFSPYNAGYFSTPCGTVSISRTVLLC